MARLTRWGNSDGGLRIPTHILETAGLRVGDEIDCRLRDDGTISLTPRKGLVGILDVSSQTSQTKKTESKW